MNRRSGIFQTLVSGLLPGADSYAWSQGCPLMAGLIVCIVSYLSAVSDCDWCRSRWLVCGATSEQLRSEGENHPVKVYKLWPRRFLQFWYLYQAEKGITEKFFHSATFSPRNQASKFVLRPRPSRLVWLQAQILCNRLFSIFGLLSPVVRKPDDFIHGISHQHSQRILSDAFSEISKRDIYSYLRFV